MFATLFLTQVASVASEGIPDGCPTQTYNRIRQGLIQSANYPFNYSSCEAWTIQSNGQNITISFEDLDLPKASDGSCIDYIMFGPTPMLKLCGKLDDPVPKVYISQRSHIWMYLSVNKQRQSRGRGFSLRYLIRSTSCNSGQFQCKNGACIWERWRCNSWDECGDGSDEKNCTKGIVKPTPPPPCGDGKFLCRNLQGEFSCFHNRQKCDGERNCQDGGDEDNCSDTPCKHILDLALPGTKTLGKCNGTLFSPNYPNPYQAGKTCDWLIQAPAGRKIQLRFEDFDLHEDRSAESVRVYDGKDEQSNVLGIYTGTGIYKPPKLIETSSNELYVKFVSSPAYTKPRTGFKARYQIKGCCIGRQKQCLFQEEDCYEPEDRCDGVWHCRVHGGDERHCAPCTGDHFSCGHKTTSCYLESERCDGKVDCTGDYGDESNCDPIKCGPHNGTFLCNNKKCIKEQWQCDGTDDCADNSDESHCSSLPSLRVIIAAVIGSLICGLLLVIALGCTCKLYALRMNEHYGTRNETPMTRLQELFNARPPPPNYDRAMVTSRPYDEVQQEMRAQLQAAQEAREQPTDTSAVGGSTSQDVNTSSAASSEHSSNNAQHERLLLVFPDSTSSDSDSDTELGGNWNHVDISIDSDIRARWRRKRKNRPRRGNGVGSSSRDLDSQASGNPSGTSTEDPAPGDLDPNQADVSSLLSAGDTASTSTCTGSVIVSMCEDSPKPDTDSIQTSPAVGGASNPPAQDELVCGFMSDSSNVASVNSEEAGATENCQANLLSEAFDGSSIEVDLQSAIGPHADVYLPLDSSSSSSSSSTSSSFNQEKPNDEHKAISTHTESGDRSQSRHGSTQDEESATHLLASGEYDCDDDDDVPLLA